MKDKKIRCAIIGPGNIGMNLLMKIKRSKLLECSLFVGRNPDSKNLAAAAQMGYNVSYDSLQALIQQESSFDILFDATSADSHRITAEMMKKLNKYTIDLTPSKIGKLCVPSLNWEECVEEDNINMVTCGGQSMVPLAYAIKSVCDDISYIETVSTISSASAGIGTRENIDDYIQTTQMALRKFTGVNNTKTMIVLNPAEPPIIMRNTLYVRGENIDMEKVSGAVYDMEKNIQGYVPGYKIIVPPTLMENDIVAVSAQVEGSGDFLPEYAGNLDIITCAAIEMGEKYAMRLMETEGGCIF